MLSKAASGKIAKEKTKQFYPAAILCEQHESAAGLLVGTLLASQKQNRSDHRFSGFVCAPSFARTHRLNLPSFRTLAT